MTLSAGKWLAATTALCRVCHAPCHALPMGWVEHVSIVRERADTVPGAARYLPYRALGCMLMEPWLC